jgi:hypothetical protein
MEIIIGKLIPDIDDNKEKTGYSNGQTKNIDERKKFSFPYVSDGDFEKILNHSKQLLCLENHESTGQSSMIHAN